MLLEIWPCACSKSVSLHHPCQYKNSNCLKESNLMYYTNHHASGSTNNTLICGMCIYAPCQWTSMCPHEHPTFSGPYMAGIWKIKFLRVKKHKNLIFTFQPYKSLFPYPLTYAHPKQQVVWHFHSGNKSLLLSKWPPGDECTLAHTIILHSCFRSC